mmetsp:Transcript_13931/g.36851  ORF Transcript_13931/g.36851 Transcript_13931/m.36851 type:complete len:239 (-) Transcript_13931:80-796(-)
MILRAADGVQAEERVRLAPRVWVRLAILQVGRLRSRGPEPGPDVPGHWVPLGGERAATTSVEASANGVLRALLRAALVKPLAFGTYVAVVRGVGTRAQRPAAGKVQTLVHTRLVTVLPRVQGGLRPRVRVDCLYDVVLAPPRPGVCVVLAVHPEGRPGAAASGDVVHGQHEEALVVYRLGLDAHGAAASLALHYRLHVCTQVDVGLGHLYKACVPSGRMIDVINESMRRVRVVPEGPA